MSMKIKGGIIVSEMKKTETVEATRHEQITTKDGRTLDVYYCNNCGYPHYGFEPISCSKCESDAPSCECWSPPPY